MWAYLGEFQTSKYRPAVLSWVGVFIGVAYTGMPSEFSLQFTSLCQFQKTLNSQL